MPINELGDAEVEQLGAPFGIHQHVGGLEVAVHDQAAMRIGHRVADLQEQGDAPAQVQPDAIAIARHHFTFDQFQRKPRLATRAHATVDQASDVGVLQAGQDRALAPETRREARIVAATPDQLQRDALREGTVAALGGEYRAHSSPTEQRRQAVRTNLAADARDQALQVGAGRGFGLHRGVVQPVSRVVRPERGSGASVRRRLQIAEQVGDQPFMRRARYWRRDLFPWLALRHGGPSPSRLRYGRRSQEFHRPGMDSIVRQIAGG